MEQIIEYLLRLSGTLAILYLFYWLVLSRLTFYTANRWYLLGYSIIALFIPLINISSVLEKARLHDNEVVQWIPIIETGDSKITNALEGSSSQWSSGSTVLLIFCVGSLLMLIRFLIRYFSVHSIRQASKLVSAGAVRIYQVDKNIIPFSFGNSIFINQSNHTEAELKDIIRHEFIHVKQRHTIDILWSECLCILNWYNPFAWLIRSAIRENLEFIADDKVIQNGIDKKQYQYLLLKVIGVPQYSIATNFNFTSLKKRIAMMNKIRTARIHCIKFLFLLPLMAFILLAFRNKSYLRHPVPATPVSTRILPEKGSMNLNTIDTVPAPPSSEGTGAPSRVQLNNKGYIITIADNHGECVVIVKDKQNRIVKAVSLVDWGKKEKEFTDQYGIIPPAPAAVPSPKPAPVVAAQPPHTLPVPAVAPVAADIAEVHVQDKRITITSKSGESENYDLNNPLQRAAFDKKYGSLSSPNTRNADDNSSGRQPTSKIILRSTQDEMDVKNDEQGKNDSTVPGRKLTLGDFNYLLFVDGKEYDKKSFEKEVILGQDDIESIEVVKDETAQQLYGDKAKNGVIIITTKMKKGNTK